MYTVHCTVHKGTDNLFITIKIYPHEEKRIYLAMVLPENMDENNYVSKY